MRRIPRRTRYQDRPVYQAETRGILVRVISEYLPGQSDPLEGRWAWAYTVEIENHGQETVQLVSRRWVITDGQGRSEEVTGAGVVGEQPTLRPGEAFRYVSGCPLPTPSGAMRGWYQMVTDAGELFEAETPAFSLDLPGARRALN
jgi:ApaG protein